MIRTPKYRLGYQNQGEIYSASLDLDRSVVIDNQLAGLSDNITDGVLSGWQISTTEVDIGETPQVEVSPGTGFISKIFTRTFSKKIGNLNNNATNFIFMKSNMINPNGGGLIMEAESPRSASLSAVFVDTTVPDWVSGNDLAAVSSVFNEIELTWTENTASDLKEYKIYRSGSNLGIYTAIATVEKGIEAYTDSELTALTPYFYKLSAIDISGNETDYASTTASATTTTADLRIPPEINRLALYPSDSSLSIIYGATSYASELFSHYLIRIDSVDSEGTLVTGTPFSNDKLYYQATGLDNNLKYIVTVKTVGVNGQQSNGSVAETHPNDSVAPLDVTGVEAASGTKEIALTWVASTDVEKAGYRVYVIRNGIQSKFVNVGLSIAKTIKSYVETSGNVRTLEDGAEYVFRITTYDAQLRESNGVYVVASTEDTIKPKEVSNLRTVVMDTKIKATWTHSTSNDVDEYLLAIKIGSDPYGTDFGIGYVQTYTITGLTNGTAVQIRIRAKDKTGNESDGKESLSVIPVLDIIPPIVPRNLRATAKDTEVFLTWNKNVEPDFSFYTIKRSAVKQSISAIPGQTLTIIPVPDGTLPTDPEYSLGTREYEVGIESSFLDVNLINGQTYAYYIKATDTRGNESIYSPVVLIQPYQGISIVPKQILDSVVSGITLSWTPVLFPDHPSTPLYPEAKEDAEYRYCNAYNIYRSENEFYGYSYIDSVPITITTYTDNSLVSGTEYYYQISAIADNAEIVVQDSSIYPTNSILLGTIEVLEHVPAITPAQRNILNLYAVVTEETASKLLLHKHSVAPTNKASVVTLSTLTMMDGTQLGSLSLDSYPLLSALTKNYYSNLAKNKTTGVAITYTKGQTFFIRPDSIVGGLPFVGDFNVLVDGVQSIIPFVIDDKRNCIVFDSILASTAIVTINGSGFNYYVPFQSDGGFDILKNSVINIDSWLDRKLQTVRFTKQLVSSDVVSVSFELKVPSFEGTRGARQVSLSPNIVLNDFTTTNRKQYFSSSGVFSEDDVVHALVDGKRTSLPHFIDVENKAIIFRSELAAGTNVALEIENVYEVEGLLPKERVGNIDGSQITEDTFEKYQLPPIDHRGRMNEKTSPEFEILTTTNKYEYFYAPAIPKAIGTGITPYAINIGDNGELVVGTSNGMIISKGFDSIIGDDGSVTESNKDGAIDFVPLKTDSIVVLAKNCAKFGGRYNGSIDIVYSPGTNGGVLADPSLTLIDEEHVLITGGRYYNTNGDYSSGGAESAHGYEYDSTTGYWIKIDTLLSSARSGHTAVLLESGEVLIAGGGLNDVEDTNQFGITVSTRIAYSSCELLTDGGLSSWSSSPATSMTVARDLHGCVRISENKYLLVGGHKTWPAVDPAFGYALPDLNDSCEIYDTTTTGSFTATATGSLNEKRYYFSLILDTKEIVILDASNGQREFYNVTNGTWERDIAESKLEQQKEVEKKSIESIDGVIKLFFKDSEDILYAVSRGSIYYSKDGAYFSIMKGLESVGVVHALSELDGTLYAATDIGVYEITSDIKNQRTWFQGGLVGNGTTEVFDLMPYDEKMYAATEIGVFFTTQASAGEIWTSIVATFESKLLEDIYNIERSGDNLFFIQSRNNLYKTDSTALDNTSVWIKVGTYSFLERESKVLARANLDIFVSSSIGLYVGSERENGFEFILADFNRNRNKRSNNVTMLELNGGDVIVGYDNEIYSIDGKLSVLGLARFSGSVPTVRINEVEVRGGFRYNNKLGSITFELKRFSNEIVDVATSYFDYYLEGGEWYSKRPYTPVIVYSNGSIVPNSDYSTDSILGRVSFTKERSKFDDIIVSISNVSFDDVGELYHDELEDRMYSSGSGLPLGLERERTCNLLQSGLSIDHVFPELGTTRNPSNCALVADSESEITSFLSNSEFYIIGRKEFDSENSTIDYVEQSKNTDIGKTALLPLFVFENKIDSTVYLWVGTENGIFVLNADELFKITNTINIIPGNEHEVTWIHSFDEKIHVASSIGLFSTDDNGDTFIKNEGNGLPEFVYSINSIGELMIVGTEDGMYYSEADSQYKTWYRCSFENPDGTEVFVLGSCFILYNRNGVLYSAIDNIILYSVTGKTWVKAYTFNALLNITISSMVFYANKLYIGTSGGVYCDGNTIKTPSAFMKLQKIEDSLEDSDVPINDLAARKTALYAVGDTGKMYVLQNEWDSEEIPNASSAQKVFLTSSDSLAVFSNDSVFSD